MPDPTGTPDDPDTPDTLTIPAFALAAAETAVNKALTLDPVSAKRVAALEGRVITIRIDTPAVALTLLPDSHGVMLMSRYQGEPDLQLSGSLSAYAKLATDKRGGIPAGITIQGDANLATQLQAIVAGLDLDWEEQLSRLTGDGIAHQAGRLVRSGSAYLRQTDNTLGLNLEEFLKEEARLLPQRFEVEEWVSEVDRLRDDVARLEARLRQLDAAPP